MEILVINGDCILTNTSANLCHLAYIRGLVEAGHNVTLLSADGRDYIIDPSMTIPDEVRCFTYYAVSFYEKASLMKIKKRGQKKSSDATQLGLTLDKPRESATKKIITFSKKAILSLYGVHGIYAKFIKKARKFRSDVEFDYILSISTPPASHLLAYKLIKAKHVRGKHWIQIWEDPWCSDVYGFSEKRKIYNEEKRLLSFAEKVCYVSPLTLKNQRKIYPESANKMYWKPLPCYYTEGDNKISFQKNIYGYFGAYYPAARNLEPFYQAAVKIGIEANICGDPSTLFPATDMIHIYARLPLDKLKPIEDGTNVLIFLCNRKGGQIPGKIYQYSATTKTILFILDGTEEEKTVLKEYFDQFNRYVFCENTVEDIIRAINKIERNCIDGVINRPLNYFTPQKIVEEILCGTEEQI